MAKPDGPVGVFVAVFDSEDTADRALKSIDELDHQGLMMDIFDHAKVVRDSNGKVEVKLAHGAHKGAKTGLAVGALVGLVFPPAFFAVAAVGAASGAAIGAVKDDAFDKKFLSGLGEYMVPGRTGIIVITEPQHMETLKETVPSAVRTTSHTFNSLDESAIREWASSIPAQAAAQDAAAPPAEA